MTSFVQPLDAGIIRCFKAHYHQEFCLHAIKKDNAGEHDIYKINLLEGMLLACKAWRQVEGSTIKNCWNHTKIQGFITVFIVNEALHTIAHSNTIGKF
jgi:DDE superfamily endonuclease